MLNEMKGRDDPYRRVFSTGESIGIQLSYLIITSLIQPLFMSLLSFLKSSELCLPMLWHIMRHGSAVGMCVIMHWTIVLACFPIWNP